MSGFKDSPKEAVLFIKHSKDKEKLPEMIQERKSLWQYAPIHMKKPQNI